MKPIILLNFKTYKESTGGKSLKLLKIIDKFKGKAKFIAAVQAADSGYSKKVKFPVYSQHVDLFKQGENTGFLIIEDLKDQGIVGTQLNHAEHKLRFDVLTKTIKRCRGKRFKTLVFTSSLAETKKLLKLKQEYIAFEDPALIGTGKSITSYKADKVKKFAQLFNRSKVLPLCGAGISNNSDLREALKLGCKGVGLSSAFVKARNPEKMLKNLLRTKD